MHTENKATLDNHTRYEENRKLNNLTMHIDEKNGTEIQHNTSRKHCDTE